MQFLHGIFVGGSLFISMQFFLVMLLCMESVRTNQMVTGSASRTLLGSRFS